MKPRLLVVELWGLGDLAIASPFLQAACRKYDVTLLAKPYARDLQPRFWPEVRVETFVAPWTAFRRKYAVWRWPWPKLFGLGQLARPRFDVGLSARWDPRDHFLLWILRARRRLGFPRLRSDFFLTDPLERPPLVAHRYENWRVLARSLEIDLPERRTLRPPGNQPSETILVHSGAGQAVRVWPIERYSGVVQKFREQGYAVQVACDPDQRSWWFQAGEAQVATPRDVTELLALLDSAGIFMGNDSGPAHLAALCGVPTFTIFGPQLPEWFAPMSPQGECLEGKPCPYKPCSDYCRFGVPYCIFNSSEDEVWGRISSFAARRLTGSPVPG